MGNPNSSIRVFKYRLYPKHSQEKNLFWVLKCARNLYNMALAERKVAYEVEGRNISLAELETLAKHYRKTFPKAIQLSSQTVQSVVKQVDLAFQAFFRRVKLGEKAGYPRFNSFLFKQYGCGVNITGRRLKLYGIGRVPVRWHRPLEGTIKTVRIVHKAGQWFAVLTCEVIKKLPLPETGNVIGIDVGVSALITTSTGEKVENPNFYRAAQAKLRVLQRALQRKVKGSKNRRKELQAVQRQHSHVANQRMDVLHKLSTKLIQENDGIALEDLSIKNMVRNKHLSKSILDSGWGMFKQYLTYKAESAGREVRLVNPAYTSKCCSNCGQAFEHFSLATRWVRCDCGLSLDRDHNAAINILKKSGWDAPVTANVECSQAQAFVRSPRL